jgi:hypothetical protein
MTLASGSRIGPYEIIAPLGAGGMGEVYRARDPRIGRNVAIKVLPASFASDPDRLGRFEQEARAAGGLNHPNLLVVFDFGTHDGSPYLVTELLEGETLRERLARDAVPPRKAADWAAQLAEALAAAHEKGVIHRDIKPENVFLTRDERVKLLDFGVSKLMDGDVAPAPDEETELRRTDPGSVLGTPGYMAPEQVRAEPVDERTDEFALGIVLAEMVSGSHPFQQATRVETMTAILKKDVTLPESLPPGLARIIDRMLAKRPGLRFQSMKDVAFALQLLSGTGVSGESSRSGISPPVESGSAHDFLAITLRRGWIGGARFTPDGSIVYGAAWEGNPLEVFVSRPGAPDARAIGLTDADVLSVSAGGELAVSLGRRLLGGWVATGTLARIPLAGGAPRRIAEKIVDADWAPDGKNFAIIRHADDGSFVLEYPIGRRLRVSGGWLSRVRFSRDGRRLAFIQHPWFGDDAGRPIVVDLEGRDVMDPGADLPTTGGLAWSPAGDEVWIAGDREQLGRDILGFDMSGKRRVVISLPGQSTMCDASPNGNVIITHDNWRREAYAGRRAEGAGRNVTWYDWPMLTALSADGSQILFEEQRAISRGGKHAQIYLRPVDGSPAVHIGDGRARAISPDGKWVAADTGVAGHLELIPTGVGESRLVRCDKFEQTVWWWFFPDGKRLLVLGSGNDKSNLAMIVPLDGSESTPTGSGVLAWPVAVSHDGESFVAPGAGERLMIHRIAGGEPIPMPGTAPGDWPIVWSDDGQFLFVYPRGRTALTVDRVNVGTGERTAWLEVRPADPAGILDIFPVWITGDGEHYAYSYRRCLSDLYLVSGAAQPRDRSK